MTKLKAIFNFVMFVCCCLAVSEQTVRAAIDAGAPDVDAVTRCTGAGSKCGSCRRQIEDMISSAAAPRESQRRVHLPTMPARRRPAA